VSRIVLGAHALHSDGGGVLLRALLPALAPHLRHAFIDTRFLDEARLLAPGISLTAVTPGPFARIAALRALPDAGIAGDRLFCFNNVPPLRRSAARTIVYVHSPFLVPGAPRVAWGVRDRLRLAFERTMLRLGRAHVDEFWLQTERMADAFRPVARGRAVSVRPFLDLTRPPPAFLPSAPRTGTFFYPAAGYAYKNHSQLYRAWACLAQRGIGARLEVTLSPDLHARRLAQAGLASEVEGIVNLGPIPRATALERLSAADALIFPSTAESFGIPMLEAAALGKPVTAAELGYVREVCVPVQTFDPHDARSIADAVARFLGCAARPVLPLGPDAFVAAILA